MADADGGIIIAIDGPAGSGKSSTARAVAATLAYRHLDSGAFYRALTLAALQAGIDPVTWDELTAAQLDELDVEGVATTTGFQMQIRGEDAGTAIRSPEVNAEVARMAAVPAVRDWLLGALRHAGRRGGLVADGRDIGTVVFPHAELKVFLNCTPAERARRRLAEQGTTRPNAGEIEAETRRLLERDRIDSERAVAPLLRAADAVLLDTTNLEFDRQVETIVRLARERGA